MTCSIFLHLTSPLYWDGQSWWNDLTALTHSGLAIQHWYFRGFMTSRQWMLMTNTLEANCSCFKSISVLCVLFFSWVSGICTAHMGGEMRIKHDNSCLLRLTAAYQNNSGVCLSNIHAETTMNIHSQSCRDWSFPWSKNLSHTLTYYTESKSLLFSFQLFNFLLYFYLEI